MSAPRLRRAHARACLTPTEQRVAELVRLGSSDATIASELCIPRPQVEQHVHHIFDKLGLAVRTA